MMLLAGDEDEPGSTLGGFGRRPAVRDRAEGRAPCHGPRRSPEGPRRRVNIPAACIVLGATCLAMPATTTGEPGDAKAQQQQTDRAALRSGARPPATAQA